MAVKVFAVDRPELPPFEMPDRFRHEVTYFMTPPGEAGVPALGPSEYWIDLAEAREALDGGVIELVSPLSSERPTEVEISDEQADWLEWMTSHDVQHIRLA